MDEKHIKKIRQRLRICSLIYYIVFIYGFVCCLWTNGHQDVLAMGLGALLFISVLRFIPDFYYRKKIPLCFESVLGILIRSVLFLYVLFMSLGTMWKIIYK